MHCCTRALLTMPLGLSIFVFIAHSCRHYSPAVP
jgi:hypothetical protein